MEIIAKNGFILNKKGTYEYAHMVNVPENEATQWVELEENEVVSEDIQLARASKIAEARAYGASDTVNSFYFNGLGLWLDPLDRNTALNVANGNTLAGVEYSTISGGGFSETLPTATAVQLLMALILYANDAQTVEEQHVTAINSLKTLDEINAYDVTSNYPSVLSF